MIAFLLLLAQAGASPGELVQSLERPDQADLEQLEESPSTLRLAYAADLEEETLVERRLKAVRQTIVAAWKVRGNEPLEIESTVSWRRGDPSPWPTLRGIGPPPYWMLRKLLRSN